MIKRISEAKNQAEAWFMYGFDLGQKKQKEIEKKIKKFLKRLFSFLEG